MEYQGRMSHWKGEMERCLARPTTTHRETAAKGKTCENMAKNDTNSAM